jgi:hypothetical protein
VKEVGVSKNSEQFYGFAPFPYVPANFLVFPIMGTEADLRQMSPPLRVFARELLICGDPNIGRWEVTPSMISLLDAMENRYRYPSSKSCDWMGGIPNAQPYGYQSEISKGSAA